MNHKNQKGEKKKKEEEKKDEVELAILIRP